nr:MAG TPA: hypothetical protein [Caudoviricetes sp.]
MQLIEAVTNLLPTLGTNDKFHATSSHFSKWLFYFKNKYKSISYNKSKIPLLQNLCIYLLFICYMFRA